MTKPLLILVVAMALAGCGRGSEAPGPVVMDEATLEEWQIALVEMRIEKNEAFADTADTPLRAEDLDGFEGLNYYNPDQQFRFRVELEREARPDTVWLAKRRGQTVPYLRAGRVAFKHEGRRFTLTVFAPAEGEEGDRQERLWLPFHDATNGSETYAGGRYLDLAVDGGGMVELDFNYAYNPLCDYNPERYNCTLPPPENRLPFPVRVGEMLLHLEESGHAAGAGAAGGDGG